MDCIETERLRLIPLNLEQLQALKNGRSELEKLLGLNSYPVMIDKSVEAEIEEAMEFWLKNVSEHPQDYSWFTGWEIVLKSRNISIGGIGFAGVPGEDGASQVGYHIDTRFHNEGYASEALGGMVDWALSDARCRVVTAETQKHNIASQKVLQKNGFHLVREKEEGILLWKLMGKRK